MPLNPFMQAAIDEARLGLEGGGKPICSVLVHNGKIIGRGHNRREQDGSAILFYGMPKIWNEDIGEP